MKNILNTAFFWIILISCSLVGKKNIPNESHRNLINNNTKDFLNEKSINGQLSEVYGLLDLREEQKKYYSEKDTSLIELFKLSQYENDLIIYKPCDGNRTSIFFNENLIVLNYTHESLAFPIINFLSNESKIEITYYYINSIKDSMSVPEIG